MKHESIGEWIGLVRAQFVAIVPELLPLFEIYAAEAQFGRQYISSDLDRLPRGAKIIEIGAGVMLLSCQLVREGYKVTALEPVGTGFSHFERMREVVLEVARLHALAPEFLASPAEDLSADKQFDYAFSVNVMEHVTNVELVLERVGDCLKENGVYRFTCPNYFFPYEPHFNLPTLISKNLTEKLLGSYYFRSRLVVDPFGTWQTLNWITSSQVIEGIKKIPGLRLKFNKTMLVSTLERIVTDADFSARRSRSLRVILGGLVFCRLHSLLQFVPIFMQPIMDCSIEKNLEATVHDPNN